MANCNFIIIPEGPYDGYFCTRKYLGDDSTRDYTFSYPYLGQSLWDGEQSPYIQVFVDGVETSRTHWTMPTNASIRFETAPDLNACIMIRRNSDPSDRLVTFEAGSRHTADVSNQSHLKNFYLIQELWDQLRDAQGVYGEDRLFNVYRRTGNGSWTALPLSTTYGPNDETNITNQAEVLVLMNGAGQQTNTYSMQEISGVTNVVFSSPPPTGVVVEVRTMTSGIAQSVQVEENTITGEMLEDCALDSPTWRRVVCIDDLGEENQVFIWREGTGGPELTVDFLTHEDISDFDTGVRQNRLDQMAAPNTSISMASHKITSLATGTASTDAVNKGQMDAAISAAVPVGSVPQIVSGQITISANGYTTENLGFNFDTLILNLQYDVTVSQQNGTQVTYDESKTYTQFGSDGTGEIEYVWAPGQTFGVNIYALKIQRVNNGFKYKRSGLGTQVIRIRYTAIKYS
jgi:hypothetical protein